MEQLDQFPGPRFTLKGKTYLYFGGTAYLGLQTDPEYQDRYMENIRRYGTHYGASRKANVQLTVYDEAETMLAETLGAEKALTLSSGYLAGQLLASYFNTPEYTLFYTRESHAALYQKPYHTFTSYDTLKEALEKHLSKHTTTPVLFMDTLENHEASYPDFNGLRDLPLSDCILIADDSHGIGVMGEGGTGAHSILATLEPKNLLVCFSLGKAIGIPAGAVAGPEKLLTKLEKTAFFGSASPANPAGLATFVQSWDLVQAKWQQLQERNTLFLNTLEPAARFRFVPGQPAFAYKDDGLTQFLKEQGILVTSFRYPNEDSEPTSRIVLTAAHSEDEIEQLAQLINHYFRGA